MGLAIGMVELNSIARGIETCDYMVKAAQIQLLRSSTVCPGKYLILIGGETGDVRASMKEGMLRGGECVVDTLYASERTSVADSCYERDYTGTGVRSSRCTGVFLSGIRDHSGRRGSEGCKCDAAGGTYWLRHRRKGLCHLTGDVGAVKAAVEAASRGSELLVGTTVIPRPSKTLFNSLL